MDVYIEGTRGNPIKRVRKPHLEVSPEEFRVHPRAE
jgi:hypothetical protein